MSPKKKKRRKRESAARTRDVENSSNKRVREEIFNIPLLETSRTTQLFGELDQILAETVRLLCRYVPATQESFRQIVEKILSGSTLGKNYYNKRDQEDGKPKTKRTTIYQPSEIRVLKLAFNLLRPQTAVRFGDTVCQVRFLRGILEEEVEKFLAATFNLLELYEELARHAQDHSIEYVRVENEIHRIHEILGLQPHDIQPVLMGRIIRTVEQNWDRYVTVRDEISKPYFRMVYTQAKELSSSGNEEQTLDNFQAGTLGLVRAIKNYTPERFADFSVVAKSWVRQAILFHLKTEVNFIKIPMANWHYLQKIEQAKIRLLNRLNRSPTSAEVAAEVDLPEVKVKKILENAQLVKVHSLDTPTSNETNHDQQGSWNRDSVEAEERTDSSLFREAELGIVRHIVNEFDQEERTIFGLISGCYEVLPDPEFTATELAEERIRQEAAKRGFDVIFK